MDISLLEAAQALLVAVIPVLTPFIIKWFKAWSEHTLLHLEGDKAKYYLGELTGAVADAVSHTSQTYVDALKKGGKFDTLEQERALEKARDTALKSLTKSAREFLEKAYEDLPELIETKVEAMVKEKKKVA